MAMLRVPWFSWTRWLPKPTGTCRHLIMTVSWRRQLAVNAERIFSGGDMLHSSMLNRSLTTVAVFCLFCTAAYSQQIFDRSTTLRNVTYNGVDLAQVLATFAYDYNVIIDLETDPAKPRSPITLQLSNVIFPQILDGIVAAGPLYGW